MQCPFDVKQKGKEMNNTNTQYIQNRYNRKRNIGHWGLAIEQIKQCPLLLLITIPIVALTVIIWVNRGTSLSGINKKGEQTNGE